MFNASFFDIALNFFDGSFNPFSTSTCFILFEVVLFLTFLMYHQNLPFLQNQQ